MSTETDENEGRTKKTTGVLRHSRRQREKQSAFDQRYTDQFAVGQHAINADKVLRTAKRFTVADYEQ